MDSPWTDNSFFLVLIISQYLNRFLLFVHHECLVVRKCIIFRKRFIVVFHHVLTSSIHIVEVVICNMTLLIELVSLLGTFAVQENMQSNVPIRFIMILMKIQGFLKISRVFAFFWILGQIWRVFFGVICGNYYFLFTYSLEFASIYVYSCMIKWVLF